jgi:hypothetical protein
MRSTPLGFQFWDCDTRVIPAQPPFLPTDEHGAEHYGSSPMWDPTTTATPSGPTNEIKKHCLVLPALHSVALSPLSAMATAHKFPKSAKKHLREGGFRSNDFWLLMKSMLKRQRLAWQRLM